MALVVKDRVQETSTTTGTGSLTLLGAVTGFQTFSSAIGNTNTTYYTIQSGSEWEVGIGTVSAGALSRDTVLESSNSGALVNFSAGTKFVFCTYPAEKSVDIETAQTLTNKTISADNNTLSGIAASSFVLSNASGNIDGSASQKAIPAGVVVGTTDSQTLTNKTISGASNTLSNIGNSSLTNSAITINGTSTSLGGSINIGTVTSVSGTGSYGGLTLSGTVTTSGNITLGGTPTGTWPISVSGSAATATTATNQSGGTVSATTGSFSGAITASGGINPGFLIKKESDPNEGGQFLLEKSSGSTLSGNLIIDLVSNSLRIFENGGSFRGAYFDVASQAAGAASRIVTETVGNAPTATALSATLDKSRMPSGSVLQVVNTFKNNTFSSTNTSYVDVTGLSATITPRSTSSKILVMCTTMHSQNSNDSILRMLRDATEIGSGTGASVNSWTMCTTDFRGGVIPQSFNLLDSPGTTSAVTYKVQLKCQGGTGYVNRRGFDTSYATGSYLTLMEIQG